MSRMTPEQKRKGLIAKIHVAQTQLGLDDDAYRSILLRITGTDSCAKMKYLSQLQDVLAEMERLGFKPTRSAVVAPKLRKTSQSKMLDKIAGLLAASGKTWPYAEGMVKRMFGVEKVEQLDNIQTHKLIAALNIHVRKQEAAKAVVAK